MSTAVTRQQIADSIGKIGVRATARALGVSVGKVTSVRRSMRAGFTLDKPDHMPRAKKAATPAQNEVRLRFAKMVHPDSAYCKLTICDAVRRAAAGQQP